MRLLGGRTPRHGSSEPRDRREAGPDRRGRHPAAPGETGRILEDPRVAGDSSPGTEPGRDHQSIAGRVECRTVGVASARGSAGRRQLQPGRGATEAVGIRQDPDVVVAPARITTRASEHDHPIRDRVVNGARVFPARKGASRRRSSGRRERNPCRSAAQPVRVRQDPHVGEIRQTDERAVAAPHDHAIRGRVVDGRMKKPCGRKRTRWIELDPRRRPNSVGVGQHPDFVGRLREVLARGGQTTAEDDQPIAGGVIDGAVIPPRGRRAARRCQGNPGRIGTCDPRDEQEAREKQNARTDELSREAGAILLLPALARADKKRAFPGRKPPPCVGSASSQRQEKLWKGASRYHGPGAPNLSPALHLLSQS